MFDDGSAGLTYAVVTDELVRAASAVLQVTESAKAATIETLTQAVRSEASTPISPHHHARRIPHAPPHRWYQEAPIACQGR